MNYLKLLTCIFFLSVCSFGFSQSNVAHIDSQSLISQMPEVKEAQAQIEKLQKTYQTEIENLEITFEDDRRKALEEKIQKRRDSILKLKELKKIKRDSLLRTKRNKLKSK